MFRSAIEVDSTSGGFATAVIQAGTRVIEYVGHKIEKHRSQEHCSNGNQYIFGLDENWDLDGDVEWNPARFLNHSCSPNCEAQLVDGRIWIVARQAIRPGEEITFNYGYDLVDYRDHPCQCKSPNCVGFMVAEELFYHVRAQQLDPS
jgi:SET domain-containing protein